MSQLKIFVSEETGGWFVTAHNRMGPYVCRGRACDLATGMIEAIQLSGGKAELVVLGQQAPRLGQAALALLRAQS